MLDQKFRPTSFKEVLGQEPVVQILRQIIIHKRYSSAYIFTGPSGTGKTTSGRIFAKAVLCESPIDGDPCNQCESCRLFNREQHFNYRELDAASCGGKDDMVDLRDEAYSVPASGKKILLIDECQDISSHGQDALLKQIEQCPDHLIYIFCTTEPEKIKKTLWDRCTKLYVTKVPTSLITPLLKNICQAENIEYDDLALELLAEKSDGHVRVAVKNLERISCIGKVTTENVQSCCNSYDDTIFEMLLNLGKDLTKVLDAYNSVSSYLSSMDFYNGVITMISDACAFLNGYNNFSERKIKILTDLKNVHGFGLLEQLNYLIGRDKYVDKLGLRSDIIVLHYKFGSIVPQKISTQNTDNSTHNIPQQQTAVNAPKLNYADYSKKPVIERAQLLRERHNNAQAPEHKETKNIHSDWPLPKEEKVGENSFDDEVLTPEEFSQNLVGGRGGL